MEKWDNSNGGFSKSSGDTPEVILTRIAKKHPIELDKQIETLKKPLILEVAYPGWQPRGWAPKEAYAPQVPPGYEEGGVRYPPVPTSFEEQTQEIIAAVKAGCQATHLHPRDYSDSFCLADNNPTAMANAYAPIFREVDAISIQHTWKKNSDGTLDYIEGLKTLLAAGEGNRYCQAAVVLFPPGDSYPLNYSASVQAGVEFMEANSVKPVYKFRSSYNVRKMHRELVETGITKSEPLILVHDMGHPFGWPMDIDPYMQIDLINSLQQTKERMPNSILGVYSGGRNWLPITITAILAGADLIRVGIEDTYWMYPHENVVIQKNIDCVMKVIDFCRTIGRPLATAEEARCIMGITRTS